MPLWEAVEMPVVEEIVGQLRPERCLVHSFVSELTFGAGRVPGEPDFLTEWSSIETLCSDKLVRDRAS